MNNNNNQLLELFFSCSNLKNLDILSKSDPQVFCYLYNDTDKSWQLCAKTEKLNNNLNPKFKETWVVQYTPHLGEQRVMFKVFDIDPNTALNHDDFLGSTLTTLEQIVNRKTFSDDLLSKRGNIHGQIHVNCEPLSLNSDKVLFTLRGKNLTKMDWGPLAKSDPYFVVSRDSTDTSSSSSGATQLNLYKSEVIDRNLNPIWECASITLDKLCLGDMNRPFKITVYDHDKMKSDDMIGYAVVSMMNMRMAYDNNTSLQLTGPHAKKSELLVLTFSVQRAIPYMPVWSTGTGSSNMNNPVPPAYSGAPANVYGSNVGPPAYVVPPTTAYGAIYPPQTPPMYNPYGGSQPQQPPAYGFVQPQQQPQQQMASPPPQYNQPPPQYNQPPAYNQPPQYGQPPQYQ